MNYEQTLSCLCALSGPSGFESEVAEAAAELLRPLTDEVYITRLGSVAGVRRCGREDAPRLLLDAHLDEIGFIVTGHDEGFLRFAPLGGVDPRMLPDREVVILTDPPIHGVVACLPPHVQTAEDMDKSLPVKDLYIDVGLPQEEAERPEPPKPEREKAERPVRGNKAQQAARRQLTICERDIARAEEGLSALDGEIEAAACDYQRLTELTAEREAAQKELDDLYERWEQLSQEAGEA